MVSWLFLLHLPSPYVIYRVVRPRVTEDGLRSFLLTYSGFIRAEYLDVLSARIIAVQDNDISDFTANY